MNRFDQAGRAQLALQRAESTSVPCPYPPCGAAVGETCRNQVTGRPLGHMPAHFARLLALSDRNERVV